MSRRGAIELNELAPRLSGGAVRVAGVVDGAKLHAGTTWRAKACRNLLQLTIEFAGVEISHRHGNEA